MYCRETNKLKKDQISTQMTLQESLSFSKKYPRDSYLVQVHTCVNLYSGTCN